MNTAHPNESEHSYSIHGRVVDAHVHIWTPDIQRYPLAPRWRTSDMDPPSFTPEELLAQCRPAGVERINLVQMSFYEDDHRYLLDAVARYPRTFSATGLLADVASEDARPLEHVQELWEAGVRAVRLVGGSLDGRGKDWMAHPHYEALYRFGAEQGLILSFQVNPTDLSEINRFCRRFPETPVVIDHLARIGLDDTKVDAATRMLCDLARHPHVRVKVGAFYALSRTGPPYLDLLSLIERIVASFGPERCMWESDAPFQAQPPHDYQSSLRLLRDHAHFLSPSDKEQILRKTAESLFFEDLANSP